MGKWALLLLVPLVEMYILIAVGGRLGALPTIGLVVLTAVVGVALLKRQGVATLTRASERLRAGELPAREMAEGMLLAVAGAFLVTPGFLTDAAGFAVLAPACRAWAVTRLLRRFGPGMGNGDDVIEGEFTRR